jgi:peptidoglycan/LPS O-acetylase OafA/YrhL
MSLATHPSSRETAPPTGRAYAEGVRREVGYIPAIEGLRGIAVLWVVVFHYVTVRSGRFVDPFVEWIDGLMPLKIIVRNGFLGVDLFFLITGFLLTLPWFKHALEGRAPPSAGSFYARRARRILPAYYVQLVLLFALFLPLLNPGLWRNDTQFVLGNVGLHAAFLHYTTPYSSASLAINGALWTLALEMQYYLLLPLIALAFLRAPTIAAVALLTVAVVWKVLSLHDLEPLISLYARIGARWNPSEAELRHFAGTQFPAYLGHFALGIVCGRAWLRRRARAANTESALLALIAIASLLILYAVLSGRMRWTGEFSWVLILTSMAVAMWAVVSRRPPWSDKLLGARPLTFVGRISYSMYLYHLPALLLFNRYASPAIGMLAFPAYFGAVLFVSTLSFHFVERPFMRMPALARSASTGSLSPDDARRPEVTS